MENQRNAEKTTAPKRKKPTHAQRGKYQGIVVAVCILIALFMGISVCANRHDGIFPNTYVADKKVSDMSNAELLSYINGTYSADKVKGQTITLRCDTKSQNINIDDLKVSFDNVALYNTVISSGKTGSFLANTFDFISRIIRPAVIEPIISYDTQVLTSAIDSVTMGLEIEPVGHTFTIGDNKITINGPVNGVRANRDSAISEAEKQIKTMKFSDIFMPLESVAPDSLDFDGFYRWLTSEAENAYYEKVDGAVKVHPSKAKVEVDKSAVKNAVDSLKDSDTNIVELSAITTQPEKTTQLLSDELYSNTLSSYSTYYGGSTAARANNVRLAASRINGIELMPGEEFSYDTTILPRTYQNGYMAAPVYVGNKVESGLGGGICQPSSTLYVAALYANLEILERHNHSLAVSYLPPGLDATIAEGYLDLRFKNSTGYPIKIIANADGGVIAFSILGFNPDNIKVEVVRSASGGRYYVTRVVYQNGTEVKREAMTSSIYGTPEKDEEKKKQDEKKQDEKKQDEKKQDEKKEEEKKEDKRETTQAPAQEPTETMTQSPAEKPSTSQSNQTASGSQSEPGLIE